MIYSLWYWAYRVKFYLTCVLPLDLRIAWLLVKRCF